MRDWALSRWLCLLAFLALTAATDLPAQDPAPVPTPSGFPSHLKVGVVPMPPIASKTKEDQWHGIAIDVWHNVAKSLNVKYDYIPYQNHEDLGKALQAGQIDVGIPSIPVFAMAPQDIGFSQPFFSSEYAAAVSPYTWKITWLNSFGALLNAGIFDLFLALLLLLLTGGLLIWACERRRNPGEFGGSIFQGIGHGIWWSAVTMTTVGYGDKAPQTLAGRMVAFIWMFSGFILLSIFVSALVSNISSKVHSGVDAVRTLKGMRVGVIADSPAADFLEARGVQATSFQDISQIKEAFAQHKIDAIFADSAHLQRVNWDPVGVHPLIISQSNGANWYAFAFRRDSPLEEPINRAILKFIQEPRWAEIISASPGSLGMPGL